MPKRTDIHKILLIGSAHSQVGACFVTPMHLVHKLVESYAAKVEGGILANSNPATIMTDPDLQMLLTQSHHSEVLTEIISKERPDAHYRLLAGKQLSNLAMGVRRRGNP